MRYDPHTEKVYKNISSSMNCYKDNSHAATMHMKELRVATPQQLPSASLNRCPFFLPKGNPLFWCLSTFIV